MKTNGTLLTELFDYYPFKLKVYDTIMGQSIYSNKQIAESISKWILSSRISQPIAGKIIEAIENNIIIIGFEKNSKLLFFLSKLINFIDDTLVAGYYSKTDKKIVVLLDKNVNILGNAIKEIPPIINHEMVHLSADYNIKHFLKHHYRYLITFYKILCQKLTGIESIDNRLIIKLINSLSYNFETILGENADLNLAKKIWTDFFKEVKNKECEKNANLVLLPYMINIEKSKNKILNMIGYKNIADCYFDAYNEIDYTLESSKTLGQEALYPSEVICTINQSNLKTETIDCINSLNLRGR